MVHNGIEYGMMGALAEGLAILRKADIGLQHHPADAETAPLRDPQYYRFRFDPAEIAEVWRRGSVVSSWLLDLTATALQEDRQLASFSGRVSDSGEGRWTALAAIEESVPAHILTTALYERFSSRGEADYADRLLSAMRKQFGGHVEKPSAGRATRWSWSASAATWRTRSSSPPLPGSRRPECSTSPSSAWP
jgi:6-phosphogluconate dehydrogenase